MSVENRRDGLPRVEDLRESPAATRFLSVEPLLEDLGPLDLTGIHWVIVGGESGPGFRPIDSSLGQGNSRPVPVEPACRSFSSNGVACEGESRPVTRRANLR